MCRFFLSILLFSLVGKTSFGQTSPQIIPVFDKQNNLVSVRIKDSISTSGLPVVIDTTFLFLHKKPVLPPNLLGKSMMTPTAWGGEGGGTVFAGLGGTFPQIYTTKPDMIGVAGLAFGAPRDKLGVILMMNVNDVSKFRTFSGNIILHRRLSNAEAVAIGGIHLFPSVRSDAGPSYFIVYSHAVQSLVSASNGVSRLHYSIGAGTGRFYTKSPADQILRGRNYRGTLLFANASFEAKPWLNLTAEWSGVNLHSGISVRPHPSLPFINLGLADLTRASGERVRFVASLHYALPLW